MDRILKIFVSGPEQDLLAEEVQVIESYPGFLLATLPQQAVAEISARYPVEDITELYRIRAGHRQLDTDQPRINRAGKTRSHPDYKGVRKLSPGAAPREAATAPVRYVPATTTNVVINSVKMANKLSTTSRMMPLRCSFSNRQVIDLS